MKLTLRDMSAGEAGTVFTVRSGGGARRRLEAMGLRKGVVVEKLTGSPFGGPVVVRIGEGRLAIGFGMAGKITVEVNRSDAT